jgi:hypothetical protein
VQKHLHIISFDIPFPANYGGAIDVFHKIRCLREAGINVILHCFQYGERKPSIELESLCSTIYYYKRSIKLFDQFSILPFNVKSRINKELKKNLLKDNHPILFEVLHTCYLLSDFDLKDRIKLFRHSNIEHNYFNELAKTEQSTLKYFYFKIEAIKLKWFEKKITHANSILSVSKSDLNYFKKTYSNTPSYYLPSFHPFDTITIKKGIGDYILYHGNLSISENYHAAMWLIEHVFSNIKYPVIIAGLNPPKALVQLVNQFPHITLKQNCSLHEMNELVSNAQIHCLYTSQETGLKLKLIHVLYAGRHVVVNQNMLTGTDLMNACVVCNTSDEYILALQDLIKKNTDDLLISKRNHAIKEMNNDKKTQSLIRLLNS